jgi:hypothetical protein
MLHQVPSVSIVDLSSFTSGGDLESRKREAKYLAEKGNINKSVGISGHGLSPDALKDTFGITKRLFNLLYEEKMKTPYPNDWFPHGSFSGIRRKKGTTKTTHETNGEKKKDINLEVSNYKIIFSRCNLKIIP